MSVNNAPGFRLDNSYARLPGSLFNLVIPTPVAKPELVLWNQCLADQLGLDSSPSTLPVRTAIAAGNAVPDGATPLAQAYAGHQYGHFTMLGDGRAILLGEHRLPDGRMRDIQLKGSGPTPYSRRGDGRAGLGPMLREYIVSEFMQAVGIPTTRSLAVAATGEQVWRETAQPGAVLTRVAASHVRVGTFEMCAARADRPALLALADHVIDRLWPACRGAERPALALFEAVQDAQARLVAQWMGVGFIHGVLNTDNVAISGETIDYGPCAFMDGYDPGTVFSSIDRDGRYAYGQQPFITQWNLARFAESLLPLIDAREDQAIKLASESLNRFPEVFAGHWRAVTAAKLGLRGSESGDAALVDDLLQRLQAGALDWTNSFRGLAEGAASPGLAGWQGGWITRLARQGDTPESVRPLLLRANPAVIPRNHRVQAALAAAEHSGDFNPLQALLAALADPFADRPELAWYRAAPQESERVLQTFCGT